MRRAFGRTSCEHHRAIAPVVGVVVLVAIVAVLAGSIAVVFGDVSPGEPAPIAAFELSADGDDARITLEHVRGEPIDADDLSIAVEVNDEPLTHQPPVPFVGSQGFRGSPTGPLNAQADSRWEPGDRGSVRVAETNEPSIAPGDEISVTIAVDGTVIAELETTAT